MERIFLNTNLTADRVCKQKNLRAVIVSKNCNVLNVETYPARSTEVFNGLPNYKQEWYFSILAGGVGKTRNRKSIVAQLISETPMGRFEILFTGDAENQTMNSINNIYPNQEFSSDVVVLPHHGAAIPGAAYLVFLKNVAPMSAISSSGLNKGYRHPRCSTMRLLEKTGSLDKEPKMHNLTLGFDIEEPGNVYNNYCNVKTNLDFHSTLNTTIGVKIAWDGNEYTIEPDGNIVIPGLLVCNQSPDCK